MDGVDLAQARVPTERETPVSAKPETPVAVEHGASCPMCHGSGSLSSGWLGKHRGWIIAGGAAVAGTGLALGEGWVTIAGLAPLLYAAPCAVMMLFCMKGMSQMQQPSSDQTSTAVPPVAADATCSAAETEKQA